ncbi:MAG TPA: ATP-binding protein [Candidatus Dormibacteraeota bacterium]|nr:ATP-binding protein [Candidatus Dormibacteraeota bacterium]
MATNHASYEFQATFADLDGGLDTLHHSVDRLREKLGRPADDPFLMRFETALAEIGGNALAHTGADVEHPVEYVLRADSTKVVAWIVDQGPAVARAWVRDMPAPTSEAGRGLPLARSLLDELDYERVGGRNRWRLVKTL